MSTLTEPQIRSLAAVLPDIGKTSLVQDRVARLREANPDLSPALAGILDLVSEVLDRAALLEASRPAGQRGTPVIKTVMVSELLGRIEEVLDLEGGRT